MRQSQALKQLLHFLIINVFCVCVCSFSVALVDAIFISTGQWFHVEAASQRDTVWLDFIARNFCIRLSKGAALSKSLEIRHEKKKNKKITEIVCTEYKKKKKTLLVNNWTRLIKRIHIISLCQRPAAHIFMIIL